MLLPNRLILLDVYILLLYIYVADRIALIEIVISHEVVLYNSPLQDPQSKSYRQLSQIQNRRLEPLYSSIWFPRALLDRLYRKTQGWTATSLSASRFSGSCWRSLRIKSAASREI